MPQSKSLSTNQSTVSRYESRREIRVDEDIARYVNNLDGKKGHVMGERFKSILIEDGIGLLQCNLSADFSPP